MIMKINYSNSKHGSTLVPLYENTVIFNEKIKKVFLANNILKVEHIDKDLWINTIVHFTDGKYAKFQLYGDGSIHLLYHELDKLKLLAIEKFIIVS